MKTRFFVIAMVVIVVGATIGIAQTAKVEPAKQFEVTFSVRYNSITLEEAAKKEADFRARYADACLVDVAVKEVEASTGWSWSISTTVSGDTTRSISIQED